MFTTKVFHDIFLISSLLWNQNFSDSYQTFCRVIYYSTCNPYALCLYTKMKNKFELFYFLYIKNISLQSLNASFLTVHIYQHLLSVLNKREIHSVKVSQMMYNFKLFQKFKHIFQLYCNCCNTCPCAWDCINSTE